ncbi:MAG: DUF3783 domain-containing protein [Clostridia bacterium]|nr:DUF3783 domain-containing protein [Clostridia bacterium]
MKPLAVCFGFSLTEQSLCAAALKEMGVEMKAAGEKEQQTALGLLCGMKGLPAPKALPAFREPLLLMAYFDQPMTVRLFALLRQKGMEPPRLRAVLTPFNCRWSAAQLRGELLRETQALGR